MRVHACPTVSSCCVDPSGRLLVTGHQDSSCGLHDIRGGRLLQTHRLHGGEVRSVRLSPCTNYLLSAGGCSVALTDLQGDLSRSLPGLVAATHRDRVVTARSHRHCPIV